MPGINRRGPTLVRDLYAYRFSPPGWWEEEEAATDKIRSFTEISLDELIIFHRFWLFKRKKKVATRWRSFNES